MEGLEATIARSSELERTARIDAEYFQKRFLHSAALIERWDRDHVAALTHVSDGNHFSISEDFVEDGVPYYRGQDVTGRFFVETAAPIHITREAFDQKHMVRSHLKKGDVLLSIIGTIGELSLVASKDPATCSCKLAILRPRNVSPEYLAVFLRSEHGQNQIERMTRGAVQKGLILEDMDQLWVSRVSEKFEKRIVEAVQASRATRNLMTRKQAQAEEDLLTAFGLSRWEPPEPIAYRQKLSSMQSAKRMDAEHFDPRHLYAEEVISRRPFKQLGELAEFVATGPAWPSSSFTTSDDGRGMPFVRIRNCKPGRIEVGDLDRLLPEGIAKFDAGLAQAGDITVGMDGIKWFYAGLLDGEAYVNQRVGWVRLEDTAPPPDYVQSVLNSPLGQSQFLRRMTIAQTVGHITLDDIRSIKIPVLTTSEVEKITTGVRQGAEAKDASDRILKLAKRAVEVAIEAGEPAAIAYLDQAEGAI